MSNHANLHYTTAFRASTSRHGVALGLLVFILSVLHVRG